LVVGRLACPSRAELPHRSGELGYPTPLVPRDGAGETDRAVGIEINVKYDP